MLILKDVAHLIVDSKTVLHSVDLLVEGDRIVKIAPNLPVPDGA